MLAPRQFGPGAASALCGLLLVLWLTLAADPVRAGAGGSGGALVPETMGYLPVEAVPGDIVLGAKGLAPGQWRSIPAHGGNLGIGFEPYWFRVHIPPGARRADWTAELRQTRAALIDAYFVSGDGRVLTHLRRGRLSPGGDLAQLTGRTQLPVPGPAAETLYLRILFTGAMRAPVRFVSAASARAAAESRLLEDGLVLGGLAIILAYNAMLAAIVRQRVYVLYLLHVLGLLGWFAVERTVAGFFLWPDLTSWKMLAPGIMLVLSSVLSLAFVRAFLDLDRQMPRAARAMSLLGFAFVGLYAWCELAGGIPSDIAFVALGVFIALCALALGIRLWTRGYRPARWFTIAWSSFLLGTAISAAALAGWLPAYPGLVDARRYGALVEVTLMALALAARIRQADHARFVAQRRAERAEATRARERASERERLLRDLRDGAGRKLAALLRRVNSNRLDREALLAALRDVLVELRLIVQGLDARPPTFGVFLGKLRRQIEPRLTDNDVRLEWAIAPELATARGEPWQLLELVRIAQEAITNALHHGHASWIRVGAGATERHGAPAVELEVRDDGVGFDPGRVHRGFGLGSIRRRAERLGGEADIASRPWRGTRVYVVVPVAAAAISTPEDIARERA